MTVIRLGVNHALKRAGALDPNPTTNLGGITRGVFVFKKLIPFGALLLGTASISSYVMMSSNHNPQPELASEMASFVQPAASMTHGSKTSLKTIAQNSPEIFVGAEESFKAPSPSLLKPLIQVQNSKVPSSATHQVSHVSKPVVHSTVRSTVHSTIQPIPKKEFSHAVYNTVKPVTHTSSQTSNGTGGQGTDLYWLSHIIHAEALDQPLNAQIAVGDVVMNRVHSPQYPNTVKGVIFQISGGHYQFTPVLNGFIYTQPDAASIEAAKKVLQGMNLVPNAYVYYTPSKTPANSWVRKQPVITSIGDFVFAK